MLRSVGLSLLFLFDVRSLLEKSIPATTRGETDIRLRFPSGHATATIISVLHDSEHLDASAELSWIAKIHALLASFGFSSAYVLLDGPRITHD